MGPLDSLIGEWRFEFSCQGLASRTVGLPHQSLVKPCSRPFSPIIKLTKVFGYFGCIRFQPTCSSLPLARGLMLQIAAGELERGQKKQSPAIASCFGGGFVDSVLRFGLWDFQGSGL